MIFLCAWRVAKERRGRQCHETWIAKVDMVSGCAHSNRKNAGFATKALGRLELLWGIAWKHETSHLYNHLL